MSKFLKNSLTAIALIPATLFSIAIPHQSATAANQYAVCLRDLNESGIPSEQGRIACSDALEPKELSACVLKIQTDTPVAPEVALDACYRVRRPKDLARCIVDINRQTIRANNENTRVNTLAIAVDSCRRSLLPRRYSECVIGLAGDPRTEETISVVSVMETCLSAEVYPSMLFPTYNQ